MKLNCVIIDDEPLARECIEGYVEQVDFLSLVGTGANPVELTQLTKSEAVDLIFLDIQMPVLNGIDYLKVAGNLPMVIITTAFPHFAIEGYKLDVLDYLLKPVTFERFFKAVVKARDYRMLHARAATNDSVRGSDEYFFIKCTNKFERIYFDDILYIQGLQNYVTIFTKKGKYITHLTLKAMEDNLSKAAFIRAHKSYIVAISKVEAVEDNHLVVESNRIPVSRNYRNDVMEVIVNSKLWKKE
jgi:DNA-binding LytR/AlgR family response regulator